MEKLIKNRSLKIKLNKGTKHIIKEWCKTLWKEDAPNHLLQHENVFVESIYLDEQPDGNYLILNVKVNGLQQVGDFFSNVKYSINDFTRKYLSEPNAKALSMISYLNKMKEAGR